MKGAIRQRSQHGSPVSCRGMQPVHYLLLAAVLVPLALMPVRRAFARRNAGRVAQLEFKREHGARIVELLGQGVEPDPRRGSPWIAIHVGDGAAMFAAARLHRGRRQARRLRAAA